MLKLCRVLLELFAYMLGAAVGIYLIPGTEPGSYLPVVFSLNLFSIGSIYIADYSEPLRSEKIDLAIANMKKRFGDISKPAISIERKAFARTCLKGSVISEELIRNLNIEELEHTLLYLHCLNSRIVKRNWLGRNITAARLEACFSFGFGFSLLFSTIFLRIQAPEKFAITYIAASLLVLAYAFTIVYQLGFIQSPKLQLAADLKLYRCMEACPQRHLQSEAE
jgi:hypothetical protein